MPVSLNRVKYLARLARLQLPPQEIKKIQTQLNDIISYIKKLDELDTSGVKPLTHPLQLTNVMREDLPKPGLAQDQALKNAPQRRGSFFSVPKVVRR